MRYYPAFLDIRHRNCLVVGGGAVGTRKVRKLLDCNARVRVVSPEVSEFIMTAADKGRIDLKVRSYKSSDLDDMFLVIGTTDDEVLNHRISMDAQRLGKLCNIADRPEICNFILPAIINRGDLVIAVSTSGKSPAFAKRVRKAIDKEYGDEYAVFLKLMGAVRKKLLSTDHEPEAHKLLFEQIIDGGIIELIRDGRMGDVDRILTKILGSGYTLKTLMQTETRC